MEKIVWITTLAIMVEGLVEYAKSIVDLFLGNNRRGAITQLGAIGGGVLLCAASGADLLAALGVELIWPWMGVVLTGIIISRGANYVSDLVGRLHKDKEV